jgi:hypothetical protein
MPVETRTRKRKSKAEHGESVNGKMVRLAKDAFVPDGALECFSFLPSEILDHCGSVKLCLVLPLTFSHRKHFRFTPRLTCTFNPLSSNFFGRGDVKSSRLVNKRWNEIFKARPY